MPPICRRSDARQLVSVERDRRTIAPGHRTISQSKRTSNNPTEKLPEWKIQSNRRKQIASGSKIDNGRMLQLLSSSRSFETNRWSTRTSRRTVPGESVMCLYFYLIQIVII